MYAGLEFQYNDVGIILISFFKYGHVSNILKTFIKCSKNVHFVYNCGQNSFKFVSKCYLVSYSDIQSFNGIGQIVLEI